MTTLLLNRTAYAPPPSDAHKATRPRPPEMDDPAEPGDDHPSFLLCWPVVIVIGTIVLLAVLRYHGWSAWPLG